MSLFQKYVMKLHCFMQLLLTFSKLCKLNFFLEIRVEMLKIVKI